MCAKLPLQECFNNKITGLERKNSRQALGKKEVKATQKLYVEGISFFRGNLYAQSLYPYFIYSTRRRQRVLKGRVVSIILTNFEKRMSTMREMEESQH